ncbi:iron donor protein CyaY [Vitiosangium sp. GDMCC 1.1324]|uniref:iron donor protein CyaY n=1 Tax=Vitiosangium sp. (strain GDMCC 1.1324) TaxID=2138576 RepID=UPI000D36BAFA|nr:iron donor protein CyaY [Vitiosangium sp. GDMCC 1.1324]PTL75363.1 iron donor protein CyaY [Vitiosangium sp. GDMCC 1.1324]
MMDETTYNQLVSAAFKRIVAAADGLDPDVLEAESTGDMVTLTTASREKCIVNTQRAVRQIWVAGRGQGIHFSYDPASGAWKDDKGKGLELFRFVADVVRDISGEELAYPA